MQITNNSPEPVVSVIIVSWNARNYPEQCLVSLTQEACRYPMEIIVVDNASSGMIRRRASKTSFHTCV